MSYCSLHNHTDYSNIRLLDCVNKVPSLIDKAIELGLTGIAITDHEAVSGHVKAIRHYKKLKESGTLPENFRLILGNEIYLTPLDNIHKDTYVPKQTKFYHYILLAKDRKGHDALRLLSSIAWGNAYRTGKMYRCPIAYEQVATVMQHYKGHIIASTACVGSFIGQMVLQLLEEEDIESQNGIKQQIVDYIEWSKAIFGEENFYIELQPTKTKKLFDVNKKLIEIAKATKTKWIITTDSHYLTEKERIVHKAYLNSKQGDREVDEFYATTYLMGEEELREYFPYLATEDVSIALANTIAIQKQCEEYDLQHEQEVPIAKKKMQNFQLLEQMQNYNNIVLFANSQYKQDKLLLQYVIQGIQEKQISLTEERLQRIDEELYHMRKVSEGIRQPLSAYYNTMKELIQLCWEEGDSFVGPARGSITGLYLAYLMDITQCDPIVWKLPYWRHIHETKLELSDIDWDTQQNRRTQILQAFKKHFGENKVISCCTFGTEKAKNAILAACRGLDISSDIGLYLSSLIPVERGFTWTLSDCFYGNEEKGRKIVKTLVQEVRQYDGLKETILGIEGLINKASIHASAVYIYNVPIVERNAIMKAPNGLSITQYNMEDSDYCGGLKFDALTVQSLDKTRQTMTYLLENGYIEWQGSLWETYKKYLHPDVLEYDDKEMWKLVGDNKIISLFQLDSVQGSTCVKKAKPENLLQLAHINSLMRLMPEGNEMPIDKFVQNKGNISYWYEEMRIAGLTKKEITIMEKYLLPLKGVAATQEDMMLMTMDKEISNFSMVEANKIRKVVAKKKMDELSTIKELFYTRGKEAGTREQFLDYVWNKQIMLQAGYSFSLNHTLPYSMIALQEMNLYTRYPSIFWNTACLAVESGSLEVSEYDDVDLELLEEGKENTTNYGKISTAVANIKNQGVSIGLPNINKAGLSFSPDVEQNQILFGMKGITRIGENIIEGIIRNRPYTNIYEVLEKIHMNIIQATMLIKAGCFDSLGERSEVMKDFLYSTIEKKKRMTLQNFNQLIERELLPDELEKERLLFLFNKFLKKNKRNDKEYAIIGDNSYRYFSTYHNADLLTIDADTQEYRIAIDKWDKIYKKGMDKAREYLKEHSEELIEKIYEMDFQELWDKYANGTYSKWEMEALNFYYHEHELKHIPAAAYGFVNFANLPIEPIVESTFTKGNKTIPLFRLNRIVGTVINKDKTKHTVTLLDMFDNVVTVKFFGEQFGVYDKRISEVQKDGTKKVIEKGWFTRGNKLVIQGIRREDNWIPKKYAKSPYHTVYIIDDVQGETLVTRYERKKGIEEEENDE